MLPDNLIIPANEPICYAAHKIIRYQFEQMLFREPGARLGTDIEELHQMRVAVRRIRSAYKTLGKFLPFQTAESFSSFLSQMTDFLGIIRNLDVFLLNANLHLDVLDEPHRIDFEDLISVVKLTREKRQELLIAFHDSHVFQDFTKSFGELLLHPIYWEGIGVISGEVVPVILLERFDRVKNYDLVSNGYQVKDLHRLRIKIKDLRYTLEFFENILGDGTLNLIEDLKNLQDHLGSLNDSVDAQRIIYNSMLIYSLKEEALEAGQAYIRFLETEVAEKRKGFSQIWNERLLMDLDGKLQGIIQI